MTVKRLSLIILLIASLTVMVIVGVDFYKVVLAEKEEPVVMEEIDPTERSINRLINNQLSMVDQTRRFDRDVDNFMRYWDIKGASFALMYKDSLIYAKGYGYANLQDSVRCDVNNIFRIASVSKLITATAVMKLREQNKLSLHSKVFGEDGILNDSIFLDLRNENLKKITVEHLLRHTAGFSSPLGDPAFYNEAVARSLNKPLPLTLDDMVLYATKNRLKTTPGGSYDYSNLGYIVLTKVIENTTQMDYETYVKDSILAPIGCYDMHIGHNFPENREPNEVYYYEVKEAEPVMAYDGSSQMVMKSNGGNNVNLLSGAGGWVASPIELLKFVTSIDDIYGSDDILSPESIETMTYDSKTKKPIGWAAVRSTEWTRSGSMAGTSALIKKQSNGYTWVFLSNSSSWNGPYLSKYMSSRISLAVSRVKKWPKRNMFDLEVINDFMATSEEMMESVQQNPS